MIADPHELDRFSPAVLSTHRRNLAKVFNRFWIFLTGFPRSLAQLLRRVVGVFCCHYQYSLTIFKGISSSLDTRSKLQPSSFKLFLSSRRFASFFGLPLGQVSFLWPASPHFLQCLTPLPLFFILAFLAPAWCRARSWPQGQGLFAQLFFLSRSNRRR